MRTFGYKGDSGKTLEQLQASLVNRAREYYVTPISDLRVDGDSGELVWGHARMQMTPFAAGKLAHRVDLPGAFIQRAPTDIAATNFNRFLPGAQGNVKLAVEHIDNAPVVVGLLAENSNPVPLEALVDHFATVGKNGLDDGGWHIDDNGLMVRFTSPNLVAEPKVGDIVRAAVDIRDYENDTGLIDVNGALFRLACSNGAVVPIVSFGGRLRREQWREPHAVIGAAAGYFDEAIKGVGGFVVGINELPHMPLALPDGGRERSRALRAADAVVSIGRGYDESVSEAIRAEEDTVFGFYNAVTRLGRDAKDRSARQKFERAGFNAVVKRGFVRDAVLNAIGEEDE